MNIFVVLAHPEPKSFNGALFGTATRSLEEEGHKVVASDLYRMGFNPVSDRHNFTTVKDPDFLKLTIRASESAVRIRAARCSARHLRSVRARALGISFLFHCGFFRLGIFPPFSQIFFPEFFLFRVFL